MENTIYFEDINLLEEIEKLPTDYHISSSEYPFYKDFNNKTYKLRDQFPKTKEDLENIGYSYVRGDKNWSTGDYHSIWGSKRIEKYDVLISFDNDDNQVRLVCAYDRETKNLSLKHIIGEN